MRICLTFLRMFSVLAACALGGAGYAQEVAQAVDSASFETGENPTDAAEERKVFTSGLEYYYRGDFDSAKAFFGEVSKSDNQLYSAASYYLANIAAHDGDTSASSLYAAALKDIPENLRGELIANYARFELANGEPENAVKLLADNASEDTLLQWLYADALWLSGKKDEAKNVLSAMLKKSFSDVGAIGAEVFVDERLDGNELALSVDINGLAADNAVSKARLEILEGKPVSEPFDEIGFLAQIIIAERGGLKNEVALRSSLASYARAPFAWRAYLALAYEAFKDGDYEKSLNYARAAEFFSPESIKTHWRCVMLQGDSYRMQKLYDTAIVCYLKIVSASALRGEPHAEALYKIGLCWFEQGRWGDAYAYFERVFIGYFKFEYWGARAYFYGAQCLYTEGMKREGNALFVEYFRRAQEKDTPIYREAKAYYQSVTKYNK